MLLVIFESPMGKSVTCPRYKRGVTLAVGGTMNSCAKCSFYRCITGRDIHLTHPDIAPTHEFRECVDCRWEGSK
jgi:hypothetical protein